VNRSLDDALRGHRAVFGLLERIVIFARVWTIVEDAAVRRIDCDGGDHPDAARPDATHLDLTARKDVAQQPSRQMRRHMHLLAVRQQKSVGLAVLVDEKLVYNARDFGQMIGIDPMHCKAPCVRLSDNSRQSPRKARAND